MQGVQRSACWGAESGEGSLLAFLEGEPFLRRFWGCLLEFGGQQLFCEGLKAAVEGESLP